MVLCGPASESCTYILLAPILAWAVLEAVLDERPLWSRLVPWCSFLLFVFSQTISWFPEHVRMLFLGILPLAGIVLWVGLVETCIRKLIQNFWAARWVNSSRATRGANATPLAIEGFQGLHRPYLYSREFSDGVRR
jgi:hypothetical protein